MKAYGDSRGTPIARIAGWLLFSTLLLVLAWGLAKNAELIRGLVFPADAVGANRTSRVTVESIDDTNGMLQAVSIFGAFGLLQVSLQSIGRSLSESRHRVARWVWFCADHPAALITAALLFVAIARTMDASVVLGGTRYFFLDDDAMITMRYARNWASGLGPVFNPGQRVEGYSSPLWMALLTLVHLVPVNETTTSLVVLVMCWALAVCVVWLGEALLRHLNVGGLWLLLGLFGMAFDQNMVFWARSGLETILLTFLLTLGTYAILAGKPRVLIVCAAFLPLVRLDGLIGAAILAMWHIARARPKLSEAVPLLAIMLAPSVLNEAIRVAYYHDVLPNTFYLKAWGLSGPWMPGLSYLLRFIVNYPLHGMCLAVLAFRNPTFSRIRPVQLLSAAYLMYTAIVGGDVLIYLRFIAPLIPLLYISIAVVISESTGLVAGGKAAIVPFIVLWTFPLANTYGHLFEVPTDPGSFFGPSILTALYIEQNTPPDTSVAVTAAGIVPYFAEEQIFIDVLGKTDAHIARSSQYDANTHVGHNKFDFDYVFRSARPDVVLAYHRCQDIDAFMQLSQQARDDLIASVPSNVSPANFYEQSHPVFIEEYYPNRISLEPAGPEKTTFGCLFANRLSHIPLTWRLEALTGEVPQ